MSQTFRDRVIATGLPLDQIIIIGSGILDALGIRKTEDIDVAASKELFDRLMNDRSWYQKTAEWGEIYLEKGDCEVWRGWIMDDSGHPTYNDLLQHTQEVEGVRYVGVDYLLGWKKDKRRPKDVHDIALIESYLGT